MEVLIAAALAAFFLWRGREKKPKAARVLVERLGLEDGDGSWRGVWRRDDVAVSFFVVEVGAGRAGLTVRGMRPLIGARALDGEVGGEVIGDPAFDGTVWLDGPPREVLAALPAETRAALQGLPMDAGFRLGQLKATLELDAVEDGAAERLLDLSTRFAFSDDDVPSRLREIALRDPVDGVAIRALLEVAQDPSAAEVLPLVVAGGGVRAQVAGWLLSGGTADGLMSWLADAGLDDGLRRRLLAHALVGDGRVGGLAIAEAEGGELALAKTRGLALED